MTCICEHYPALVRLDCPLHGEDGPYGPKRGASLEDRADEIHKIRQAVEDERKACLKIVEDNNCDGAHTGCCGTDLTMLDVIRKRSTLRTEER